VRRWWPWSRRPRFVAQPPPPAAPRAPVDVTIGTVNVRNFGGRVVILVDAGPLATRLEMAPATGWRLAAAIEAAADAADA